VFPGEKLNLHIFEPRYKQLIQDCFAAKKPFGIPTVLNNVISEMGTLMYIREIVQVYDDGKMDIKTEGDKVFQILENIQTIPDKLYNGAIVTYPENIYNGKTVLMEKLIEDTRALHYHLQVVKKFARADELLTTYDIAHHTGMNIEEEYAFMELLQELHRQEYIRRHLKKVLPVVAEMESLKQRVKLNGHFKNLKGYEF
jgi:Lon protease-like protein